MRNQFARVIALVVPHLFEEFPEVERLGLLRQFVEYAPASAFSLAQSVKESFQLRVHNSPEKIHPKSIGVVYRLLPYFTPVCPSIQSERPIEVVARWRRMWLRPPAWTADKKRDYPGLKVLIFLAVIHPRSEERRVGKECRSRWS